MSRSTTNGMISDVTPTPLEHIREAEAAAAGRIAATREATAHCLRDASARGNAIVRAARGAGRRDGEQRREEIIAAARQAAETRRAQADDQAAAIRRAGEQKMAAAVSFAVDVVLRTR